MLASYVFPGSFCPPTYGHLHTLQKAAAMFERVIVVCSTNPEKHDNWFSPQQCVQLWHSYDLPDNVSVQYFGQGQMDLSQVVMIRGLRDVSEMEYEQKVMDFNHRQFGINGYVHLFSQPQFSQISSSRVRQAASQLDLEKLAEQVAPQVVSALLEKVLAAKNIFLVAGKPGSGKSTWLKHLCQQEDNYWINTDDFSDKLKPILRARFGRDDLVSLYLEIPDEVTTFIKDPWFDLLKQALHDVPSGHNIFVEIAYGLSSDKSMFRYLGGKVIYVGCDNDQQNLDRIDQRGTPEHKVFVDRIPGWEVSAKIAQQNRLRLFRIDSSGSPADLYHEANRFDHWLRRGGETRISFAGSHRP